MGFNSAFKGVILIASARQRCSGVYVYFVDFSLLCLMHCCLIYDCYVKLLVL
jgi:hypothetical protein